MKRKLRNLAWIAFAAYGILMLWLLFGQRIGADSSKPYLERLMDNLNLIPFKTILEYVQMILTDAGVTPFAVRHAVINLAGNVVMFLPLGFFLPCLWPKVRTVGRFLLCTIAIILIIEIIQLLTLLGSCDIDDLILNVLGASAGYLLHLIVGRTGVMGHEK